ncbi:MAG: cobalt ECF transporter T component CbiQ [Anaerovoracaceae bacterium]
MIIIDKLCYLSKLRYVNASEKFAFAMLTLVFCIVSRSITLAIFVLGVNGILSIKFGGIPWRRYNKLMLVPSAFLLLSTVTIILNLSKTPLDAFAFQIGSYYITGSWESIAFGVQLILTALASVSCLYFLSLSTPMTDILSVLRKIHCPQLLVELMLLIYRFIFVLLDIAYYITTSQKARLGHKDYKTSMKSFGAMASVLFIRAMKRSSALFDAMESRCYDGEIKVLEEDLPPKKKNIIMITIFQLFLLGFTIYIKLFS